MVQFSDKLIPKSVSAISGAIRTGSKYAVLKAVEPLLRGVKIGRTEKGIPKLEDANNAGTKLSSQCCLILTEGEIHFPTFTIKLSALLEPQEVLDQNYVE